ncbi:hypothetical protein LC55x_4856 [Lysobacter capsici]|nr:hypothetical protein LC55x_4856 [Lysobacter capsici]
MASRASARSHYHRRFIQRLRRYLTLPPKRLRGAAAFERR